MRARLNRVVLYKLRGFTILEVVVIVCVLTVLSTVVATRLSDARESALKAQATADAQELQRAYDRALTYNLDIFPDDSIPRFSSNAYNNSLISQIPSSSSLSRIHLADGTHITNKSAEFITRTNQSSGSPLIVIISSPTSGGTYYSGEHLTLAAAVTSVSPIQQVDFLDNGLVIASAVASSYSGATTLAVGQHTFTIQATSTEGQTGQSSVTITVLQSSPPVATLNSTPAAGTYRISTAITLNAVASAVDIPDAITKLEIYQGSNLLGTGNNVTELTQAWTSATPGTYNFTAKAYDNHSGTKVSDPISFILSPDEPPDISITSPVDGRIFPAGTSISITASATDRNSGGTITGVSLFDGATQLASSSSYTVNSPTAGSHVFTAKATDSFGSQNTSAAVTVFVAQAPTVTLSLARVSDFYGTRDPGSQTSFTNPTSMTLHATASDSTPGAVTGINFKDGSTLLGSADGSGNYTWGTPSDGSHSLTAEVLDSVPMSGTSAVVSISVATFINNNPEVVLAGVSDGTYPYPTDFSLMATAADSDPDDAITALSFKTNGFTLATTSGGSLARTWTPAVGTYAVIASASDRFGGVSNTPAVNVTILDNPTPAITLATIPAIATMGTPVLLSATSVTSVTNIEFYVNGAKVGSSAGSPYTYNWDPSPRGIVTVFARGYNRFGTSGDSAAQTNYVDQPAVVSITSPTAGTSVPQNSAITLHASATDADGITQVDIYADGSLAGSSSVGPDYTTSWTASSLGATEVYAKVLDSHDVYTESAHVVITVASNQMPIVNLSLSASGTVAFGSTLYFSVTADSGDPDGALTRVEYHRVSGATTNLIDTGVQNSPAAGYNDFAWNATTPGPVQWTATPAGRYSFFARAFDNSGAHLDSAPIAA
jgi:Tfp pilus assembly protein PilE